MGEPERPPSLASPVGMPVIKMLDVSKVKLRPREPSQKRDSSEDQEVVTRKPAWMNDLKTDNRRSVGIFLEKQELSQIRQKEGDVTSPPVTEVNSQSPRGTNSWRNNEIS